MKRDVNKRKKIMLFDKNACYYISKYAEIVVYPIARKSKIF